MKIDVPVMTVVNSGEIAKVMMRVRGYLQDTNTPPTVGASACLMLFASMLKASGHSEQVGHDSLDKIFRALDTEKAS